MLSVFFGSDRKAVVDATNNAATKNGEVVTIDEQSFVPNQFEDLTANTSLFGEVLTYVIDTPSSEAEFNESCLASLQDMAESQNQFFVIEGALLASVKKKYAKHAATLEEFSADKPERFNTFSLAEAFAKRDKKTLWVLIQEARLLGIKEEEMIGILWWQIKAIRLASVTKTADEAGMKEYPYRKAKQALSKYSEDEILDTARNLLQLYHEGHKGVTDIELSFEKWALTI